jgi:nitrate/nitrite transporter NarK
MNELRKTLIDSTFAKWSVLLLVSFTMAANYYFYDALSPLQDLIQEKLKFSGSNWGLFNSAYSFPNTFLAMAVIGGIILDKLGIRITGSTFVVLMVLGSFFTAYGASDYFHQGGLGHAFFGSFLTSYSSEFKVMFLGFLLFGLGAETSIVVISKVIVKWFKGSQLAMALGINLGIARLGTAMALIVSPRLVASDFWTRPIWFAVLLMAIGMVTFLIYLMIDVKLDRQVKANQLSSPEDDFKFADLVKLVRNPSFIYIALLCVTFYSAVFPFIKYATAMLQNKFGLERELSSTIVSIIPFSTAIFTPLFGLFTDYKGRSASIMILGSFMLILVHLTFTFTNITPYIPMSILGITFSLIPAAMWPSVAKIVDTSKIGTAYGFIFSIQNLGLFIFPMLIGKVLDMANPGITPELVEQGKAVYDYTYPILMLACLGVIALIFAILLKREDKTSGFGLELPNKQ